MRAFASALDAIPLALAENSGLSAISTLAEVKSRHVTEGNSRLGIDCNSRGQNGAWTVGTSDASAKNRATTRYEGAVRV